MMAVLEMESKNGLTPKRIAELVCLDTKYRFIVSLVIRQTHSHSKPPDDELADLGVRQRNRDAMTESLIKCHESICRVEAEVNEWMAGGSLPLAFGPVATSGAIAVMTQFLPVLHAHKAMLRAFMEWARAEGPTGPTKSTLSKAAAAFAAPTVAMEDEASAALIDRLVETSTALHGDCARTLRRVRQPNAAPTAPTTSTPLRGSTAPTLETPEHAPVEVGNQPIPETGTPVSLIGHNDSLG